MENKKTLLVTGGSGFIGSNLVRYLMSDTEQHIVNVDKMTYAASSSSLEDVAGDKRYKHVKADICDSNVIRSVFDHFKPCAVVHLAAESHVDRSIDSPGQFIETNVVGTLNMLQESLHYIRNFKDTADFRFLHISTDEVYGSLSISDKSFTEKTAYDPHSPYSASKAASDHLVRAWHDTYNLPTLITNCSNNYGPYQFPEKLIPVVILKCLAGETIPIYGTGDNIRDWLYVEDHVKAIYTVLSKGELGQTYNIGGNNELTNVYLVNQICGILDGMIPITQRKRAIKSYRDLITFVDDRPGHDKRYSIDASKIANKLGWEPTESSVTGFEKTIKWYVKNKRWWKDILSGDYTLKRQGHRQ
ncbi:dTDP-glucose 4,6-dehydratase [bacterium]|nr:dTDP-glucose 4,6-dehydratase [bacterium]